MKMLQEQYDDGKNHSIEVWDKWYDELLEYLESLKYEVFSLKRTN